MIKEIIRYKSKSQIWRLLVGSPDTLVIESRDTNSKQAFYHAINLNSGKIIFKDYLFADEFWIGIEKIYKDVILFHKYAKPDMPSHRSIFAFDLFEQKLLWENDLFEFAFVQDNIVYCKVNSMTGLKYYGIDYRTGDIVANIGDNHDKIEKLILNFNQDDEYKDYLFTSKYDESQTNQATSAIIASKLESVEIEGEVEYIQYQDFLIFNFHSKTELKKLENDLYIFNVSGGKELFHEKLNSSVNAYVPDSFFLYNGELFFIKELQEVFVYKLSD